MMKISQLQSQFEASHRMLLLTQVRQLTSHFSSLKLEEAFTLEYESIFDRLGRKISSFASLS
jgi:hypothetical protein